MREIQKPRYYVPAVRVVKYVGDREATFVVHVVDSHSGNAVREYTTLESSEVAALVMNAMRIAYNLNGATK